MTEREQIMRTVVENPNDIVARLVIADYLEENGFEAHARFIRADIAGTLSDRDFLMDIAEHGREWFDGEIIVMRESMWKEYKGFRVIPNTTGFVKNGFVEKISCEPRVWFEYGHLWVNTNPVRHVRCYGYEPIEVGEDHSLANVFYSWSEGSSHPIEPWASLFKLLWEANDDRGYINHGIRYTFHDDRPSAMTAMSDALIKWAWEQTDDRA